MMTLRAPTGTKAKLMQWLKGLRDQGVGLVIEAAGEPKVASSMLDPRKSNVFIGTEETTLQGTKEAREALFES